ncbi:MAG: AI-2E family transporter [Myxococcota bacterium]|nr:AI-2E family transporter [Myxococcota bacterium]
MPPEGTPPPPAIASDPNFLSRAVEATTRVLLVLALLAWCFSILRPFVVPVAWAVIIAVAVLPLHLWLRDRLGGRERLAAALLTGAALIGLLGTTVVLGSTLVEGSQLIANSLDAEKLHVPAPPTTVRDWPLVGDRVFEVWALASQNLSAALEPIRPQLIALGRSLLSVVAGFGLTLASTLLSLIVAGVLLANHETGGRVAASIARRLAGERGGHFASLAGDTVQSVAQGILGVAVIQSLLAGLGFVAIGVPGAGLWALIALLLCVVQVGLLLLAIPMLIWVWSTAEPLAATLFTVWMVFVSVIDNILKPILLGRGVKVPMLVIFLGAIGGFLASGIIGLFVGAVVLVLGYTMFQAWLEQ